MNQYLFYISAKFCSDQYNKLKNMASKVIGEKMKVRALNFLLTWGGGIFYLRNLVLSIKIKQKEKPNKNETTSKSPLYLAFNIEDLEKCSEEDIKSIERHLDSNSYLLGYEPSALDKDAYKSLKTRKFSNWQDFPNLQRWFCHIESFSSDEQNAFMVEKNLKYLDWLCSFFAQIC